MSSFYLHISVIVKSALTLHYTFYLNEYKFESWKKIRYRVKKGNPGWKTL